MSDNTVMAYTPTQLHAFLLKAIPARENVLIQGPPGVGKTQIVKQACDAVGADSYLFHPVTKEPTDLTGLPKITDNEVRFVPYDVALILARATKPTILFIDDLGQSTVAMQGALMQWVEGGQLDGLKLSPFVGFIGATNRRTDRAGVTGIIEPLKARFTIVEMATALQDFLLMGARRKFHPGILAYLKISPQHLNNFQPTADMVNSPNPRNWEAVSRILAMGLPDALQLVPICGRVGIEAGTAFCAFMKIWSTLADPEHVLANPKTAAVPTETSALWALTTSLADHVRPESMGNLLIYLQRVLKAGGEEYAATCVKLFTARDASLRSGKDYVGAMTGPLGRLMLGDDAQQWTPRYMVRNRASHCADVIP